VEDVVSIESKIAIDTFSTFPPEIDGCACYFSNDETEFKNRKYIYADDFGNNAFVSINGIMTKFVLSKSDTLPDNHSVKIFTADKYDIIIDVKQVGKIDETWQQKGTMTIKPKGEQTIIKKIYGECGC
ncbi:MAG: hypothetical protein M3R17_10295, partial [Bacteroidota bacterium]|nr:hypothetical protein [Bacteroidota bacterium]